MLFINLKILKTIDNNIHHNQKSVDHTSTSKVEDTILAGDGVFPNTSSSYPPLI